MTGMYVVTTRSIVCRGSVGWCSPSGGGKVVEGLVRRDSDDESSGVSTVGNEGVSTHFWNWDSCGGYSFSVLYWQWNGGYWNTRTRKFLFSLVRVPLSVHTDRGSRSTSTPVCWYICSRSITCVNHWPTYNEKVVDYLKRLWPHLGKTTNYNYVVIEYHRLNGMVQTHISNKTENSIKKFLVH